MIVMRENNNNHLGVHCTNQSSGDQSPRCFRSVQVSTNIQYHRTHKNTQIDRIDISVRFHKKGWVDCQREAV
jgi:hypothetical protein